MHLLVVVPASPSTAPDESLPVAIAYMASGAFRPGRRAATSLELSASWELGSSSPPSPREDMHGRRRRGRSHSQSVSPVHFRDESPSKRRNDSGIGGLGPRGRAVLLMSCSLGVHLAGYELSRAAVTSLFTSDGLGFGSGHDGGEKGGGGLSALPMAVGCVSPFSVGLFWLYASTLSYGGPSHALRAHTLICAGIQIVAGWALRALEQYSKMEMSKEMGTLTNSSELGYDVQAWSKPLLFVLFVAGNAYVQLLYNQHWAFISSVLTPEEGARAFAPIAGLGSIGSTLAAASVSYLVERTSLISLLHMAGVSYIVCAVLADGAFGIARAGGFEPGGEEKRHENGATNSATATAATPPSSPNATTPSSVGSKGAYAPVNGSKQADVNSPTPLLPCCKKGNIFQQAHALFQRVPVLGALFLEVIVSQCLSSLVNFIYLCRLKATITDDAARAGWSGGFYAWINGVSGVFQFFAIPVLLRYCEAHRIWLFMPTLMLGCTIFTLATFQSSGLMGASASFFCIKTMEYSLRGAANEMLYVSLDYESRYLGKKVVSLIAGKFGKSAMAVALSIIMVVYGESSKMMWWLSATALGFTLLWLLMSVRLHSLIEATT